MYLFFEVILNYTFLKILVKTNRLSKYVRSMQHVKYLVNDLRLLFAQFGPYLSSGYSYQKRSLTQKETLLMLKTTMHNKFERFAEKINKVVGSPGWFILSMFLIIIWVPSGFIFGWGDTWQLIINTTTTILTFLMVSLLQTSQNRWERKMDMDQEKEKRNLTIILNEIKRLEKEIEGPVEKAEKEVNSLKNPIQ